MMNLKRVERFLGLICYLSWKLCFLFSLLFIPFKFLFLMVSLVVLISSRLEQLRLMYPKLDLKLKLKLWFIP